MLATVGCDAAAQLPNVDKTSPNASSASTSDAMLMPVKRSVILKAAAPAGGMYGGSVAGRAVSDAVALGGAVTEPEADAPVDSVAVADGDV